MRECFDTWTFRALFRQPENTRALLIRGRAARDCLLIRMYVLVCTGAQLRANLILLTGQIFCLPRLSSFLLILR